MRNHRFGQRFFCGVLVSCLLFVPAYAGAASNSSKLGQLHAVQEAASRARMASSAAQRTGMRSIGRGHSNVRNGKTMGLLGAAMMALGFFQVAQGLKGLMAANEADQLAAKDSANAGNLGVLASEDRAASGNASTSLGVPVDISSEASTLAQATKATTTAENSASPVSEGSIQVVSLDSRSLRTGEIGAVLAEIEEHYGIPRDRLVQELAKGRDPRDLLTRAPENAASETEAKEAYDQANRMFAEDMQATAGPEALALATAPATTGTTGAAVAAPADGLRESGHSRKKDLIDRLARRPAEVEASEGIAWAPEVSPEVQSALLAREEEAKKIPVAELSLFDVVHLKYQEKLRMIYGQTERPKGY